MDFTGPDWLGEQGILVADEACVFCICCDNMLVVSCAGRMINQIFDQLIGQVLVTWLAGWLAVDC